uniref:MSP domain-containing protein n=1 Tax=Angiostrongylus cantonensis TaxID=6313 RepID=A0A0K0CWF5_ANGCA
MVQDPLAVRQFPQSTDYHLLTAWKNSQQNYTIDHGQPTIRAFVVKVEAVNAIKQRILKPKKVKGFSKEDFPERLFASDQIVNGLSANLY